MPPDGTTIRSHAVPGTARAPGRRGPARLSRGLSGGRRGRAVGPPSGTDSAGRRRGPLPGHRCRRHRGRRHRGARRGVEQAAAAQRLRAADRGGRRPRGHRLRGQRPPDLRLLDHLGPTSDRGGAELCRGLHPHHYRRRAGHGAWLLSRQGCRVRRVGGRHGGRSRTRPPMSGWCRARATWWFAGSQATFTWLPPTATSSLPTAAAASAHTRQRARSDSPTSTAPSPSHPATALRCPATWASSASAPPVSRRSRTGAPRRPGGAA